MITPDELLDGMAQDAATIQQAIDLLRPIVVKNYGSELFTDNALHPRQTAQGENYPGLAKLLVELIALHGRITLDVAGQRAVIEQMKHRVDGGNSYIRFPRLGEEFQE